MAIARRKAKKKVTKKKVTKRRVVRRRAPASDPVTDFANMLEGLGFWVDTRGHKNRANIRIGERGEVLSRSIQLEVVFGEVTNIALKPTGTIWFRLSIDQISDNRDGPFHSSAEGSKRFFESLTSALNAFSKKIEERPWYSG